MKRIISLLVVLMIVSSQSVWATEDVKRDYQDKKTNEALNRINETSSRNKELVKKLKADIDFEVVYEDEAGNYQVIPSNNVKSKDDYARFQSKLKGFTAQGTKTVSASNYTPKFSEYLVQKFSDTVWDSDSWFGDEEITVNGTSSTAYCLDTTCSLFGPPSQSWNTLQAQTDSFQFDYDYVSTTAGVAFSPQPSANASWTISNTSSVYTISWPDINVKKSSTARAYGEVYYRVNQITGYTHNSSAIATSSSGPVHVNAWKYSSIS
jgi:hypothetical protein